jgi:hypothetical protein
MKKELKSSLAIQMKSDKQIKEKAIVPKFSKTICKNLPRRKSFLLMCSKKRDLSLIKLNCKMKVYFVLVVDAKFLLLKSNKRNSFHHSPTLGKWIVQPIQLEIKE